MLSVRYIPFELEFEYPFETAKGKKMVQPTLIVALGVGNVYGFGEAPAISYYHVTVDQMVDQLRSVEQVITKYAMTDPERFWHFLHHLLPDAHFLTAALDMAGWDLFARLNRKSLRDTLAIIPGAAPLSDYTIGLDTSELMINKIVNHSAPFYKIKLNHADDLNMLAKLRAITDKPFYVDANESWRFADLCAVLPDLVKLNVIMIEQPLQVHEMAAMKELKQISPIKLIADESCKTEDQVAGCATMFHGINIKLTKCGGLTPAMRMIREAKSLGMQIMLGSMNESSIGTAAIAALLPLADLADLDGPLLLKEDIATGLTYYFGKISCSGSIGSGVQFTGKKFVTK